VDANNIEVKETVSASKKLSTKEAAELVRKATKVIVAKGKKRSDFKPAGKAPKEVVEAMLGPTGNLRAPCAVVGKTVIVGFNEEVYEEVFG
jgi:arsenate reductase-like glutaredoxin family protein